MFKTGSKFLYALAAFGFVAAVAYAIATSGHEVGMESFLGPLSLGYKGFVGEHTGYAILIGLSVTSLFLAVFLSALREADADAVAQVAGVEVVPEVEPPATVNYWPLVGAFSLAAVALGLAVGSTLFVIGMVGLTITVVEWAARTWSDRATGDVEVNRQIRNRVMLPFEVPGIAVLAVAGVVLAVSRMLLALPKAGSYAVFSLVPVLVLAIGALIVMRPRLSQSVVAAILIVGALAILGGGIAAAIHGEREHSGGHEEEHGESSLAPLRSPAHTVIQVGS